MLMTTRSGAPATNAVTAVVLPVPKSASPVMIAFELAPRRVRNIFICMAEAFCASSRMT